MQTSNWQNHQAALPENLIAARKKHDPQFNRKITTFSSNIHHSPQKSSHPPLRNPAGKRPAGTRASGLRQIQRAPVPPAGTQASGLRPSSLPPRAPRFYAGYNPSPLSRFLSISLDFSRLLPLPHLPPSPFSRKISPGQSATGLFRHMCFPAISPPCAICRLSLQYRFRCRAWLCAGLADCNTQPRSRRQRQRRLSPNGRR